MTRIFEAIGRVSVRFRYVVVVVWLAALVSAVAFLPSIGSVVQNNLSTFLPKDAPSLKSAHLAGVFQKVADSIVIVVIDDAHAPLDATQLGYAERVAQELRSVPTVLRSEVAAVSANGKAEQIEVLSSTSQFDHTGVQTLVHQINARLDSLHPPSGVAIHLAGTVATAVAQADQNSTSASATQDFSVLFILVLLFFVFRSVLAPFLTLLPALVVTVLAQPIVARLTSVLHYQVSNVTQLLLIVLVLGAGTDYGLFLVFRIREELARGLEPKQAVARAVARVGESITFSALTVISAVLMLITATFGFYKGLGFPLAIAVFLMLLAGVTLQPALFAIVGRRAFWPSKAHVPTEDKRYGLWGRVAGRLVTRPVLTLVVGVVFFGALAAFAPLNKPSGFAANVQAPTGTSAYYGNKALATYFPKSTYNPTELIFKFRTSVFSHPGTLTTLQQAIQASPLFTDVNGALDPAGVPLPLTVYAHLHAVLGPPQQLPPTPTTTAVPATLYQLYRATANYVSPGGHVVLYETTLAAGDPGLTPAIDAVPSIRSFTSALASRVGAQASGVAGEAPGSYDISSASNHDLVHIVPLVILIIALLLALVLRSAVAPFFLVASVALSFFAALGLAVVIFMEIGHSSGLVFVLPFMLFLFLLALGEDYNILVMTRIREESHHHTVKEAVVAAIGATGPAVTSAGIVLAGTFLVLGLAAGGQAEVQQIGVALALGVLMDTFLVRTLLVPSAVVLLGRISWWPSRLADLVADPPRPAPEEPKEVEGQRV